jgi:broad specificity phosphatase PhoE
MKLYLVRHGESLSSTLADEALLPRDEANDLTPLGRQEAVALARFLKSHCSAPVLWSSPIKRARQTAEFIGRDLGLEPCYVEALGEREFGFLAGVTVAVSRSLQEQDYIAPNECREGAESISVHRARISSWFEEHVERHQIAEAIVVSHGGTIEQLHMHLLGSPVSHASSCFTKLGTGRFHLWTRLTALDGRPVWRLDAVDMAPA